MGGHHHGQPKDEVRQGAVEEGNGKIKTETNINLRAAALHVLGDLLAAVGKLKRNKKKEEKQYFLAYQIIKVSWCHLLFLSLNLR